MPTNLFNCPIADCTWTHRDLGPELLDYNASPDDVHAQAVLHNATVEHTLRAHYESHEVEQWVRLVSKLQSEFATRGKPLLCVGCISDRYEAEQAGQPLPALNPAQTVVDGNASCLAHVSFGEPAVQLPGRTRGGLIVGGG